MKTAQYIINQADDQIRVMAGPLYMGVDNIPALVRQFRGARPHDPITAISGPDLDALLGNVSEAA